MSPEIAAAEDHEQLIRLNAAYINCVKSRDVRTFEEILADDFLCSQPDGSLVDKRTFLGHVVRSSSFAELSAEDVRVRILGDIAIIHAATVYALTEGERRRGRYTDVWARRNGRWLAVSAHVTR
jgi:ketosteroid isomerase-like protein